MWIKVTMVDTGEIAWVLTQNIAVVLPYQGDDEYRGQTVIQFIGKELFIRVQESVEEVKNLISQAEGVLTYGV